MAVSYGGAILFGRDAVRTRYFPEAGVSKIRTRVSARILRIEIN